MHDDDDDESWIGAETSRKTCWAARVEPGGARVRVYAASIDDYHDDDADADGSSTARPTDFLTLSLGVDDARRRVRIARGIEVARDGAEMLTRVRETFERGSVEVGEALTRADGSGLTATFDANDARNGGRMTTKVVDFEWCGKVVGGNLTRERVLERIVVGLGATARWKRRRAEEREASEKQTKRPKSTSATPASSPAKGTSVGKWMSERRTRPRLRALAEEDKETAD